MCSEGASLRGPQRQISFFCRPLYNSFCIVQLYDRAVDGSQRPSFWQSILGACNIPAALYLLYWMENTEIICESWQG